MSSLPNTLIDDGENGLLDQYGNTEADPFHYCTFPDCGCDGARLCQARSGANTAARILNLEHRPRQSGQIAQTAVFEAITLAWMTKKP